MLAVRLHDDGLKVEEVETPSPGPDELLVVWLPMGGLTAFERVAARGKRGKVVLEVGTH